MKTAYPSLAHVIYYVCAINILSVMAKNQCTVTQENADCSHMELSVIPPDLPTTIKILDLSHNRLKKLPAANLTRYNKLEHLDVGYNTLHSLEKALCENLPLLKILNLQHNEFVKNFQNAFISCQNLVELRLNSNGIREITGNPFEKLQSLQILDVSHNKMTSTALGDNEQLANLNELIFSHNLIKEINKEDLAYLGNSSVQRLDLSSNPVNKIIPECFQQLRNLHTLVMANMTLGFTLTELLCSELAATKIEVLILLNSQLSKIHNTTLKGLASTNLTTLDISKNVLSQIDDDSFIYLSNLKNLNLEENQVSHLSSKAFNGLSHVTSLNLKNFFSSSKDAKIDDLSFQWLRNLENLNMETNRQITTTELTFTGLISLKNVSFSECTFPVITNKTFSSFSTSPLTLLNLTKTNLAKLEYKAFSHLKYLQVLDLGLNRIDQDLTGYEFDGLHNLKMIYLSYNKRLTLTSNSFNSVPNLEKLHLRRTALTFGNPSTSPFSHLQNLTFLDLSNNNIANIEYNIFAGLHNLRILNLEHNNLERYWKKANPGGPVLFLKGLNSLEKLQLSYNGFDEIPADAFKGLSSLKRLEMDNNNVNLLSPLLFDDQRSLVALTFHKNLITSVEENLFKNVFSSLHLLDIGSNPFDCTCQSIAWFANWLNTTNTSVPGEYICNTPINYHGVLVKDFDSSPCKDTAPFKSVFIITFTFTSCFIVLVLLLHFQGWRIKFYASILENKILGFREIDPGNQRFDYDAYIIHANKDLTWVERYLLPLEEENSHPRFCFEERDFEGGKPILESIVQTIQNSRKIIFIITQNFLEDQWCKRFKIHQAVRQAIEQSRDSIILLFLEDIPDYKLNHTICLRRGMFKNRCILEWPEHKERVNAFKQKLKNALGSSNLIN